MDLWAIWQDKRQRTIYIAVFSLIVNLVYAFYNGCLGIEAGDLWFFATGIYYLLLAALRFGVVISHRKQTRRKARLTVRITGILLSGMSILLCGILYLNLNRNNATAYGTIPMITIAAYTFTKITIAIVDAVKNRKNKAPLSGAVRCIRYAQVSVSLLSMQQSMLVSFNGMEAGKALALNIFTGTAVNLLVLGLGILLILKSKKE